MNTRESLLEEFDRTDERTRRLIDNLGDDSLEVPYHRGINPPIWELGHCAFFYEYFLLRELDKCAPQMPGYDDIWDSFEIDHRERWRKDVVPDKQAAFDYYNRIIDTTRERIVNQPMTPECLYLYKYVIFHQHMHIESLVWCRQTLGYSAPPSFVDCSKNMPELATAKEAEGDAEIPGGSYFIGMPGESEDFAAIDFSFDNEKPGFAKEIEPFKIAKTLTSNRQFLEFVEDDGYKRKELWSSGGQRFLRQTESMHPEYWRQEDDGSWSCRLFDRWLPLNLDAPVVHVSFWEAEAFCHWAGRRLPTEYEWEAAARGKDGLKFPWGNEMDANLADLDATRMAQAPVTAYPRGASPSGCLQMLGTCWEWTSSQFLPYDGFKVDMYPYMSTIQFGDHKVTKGGSCATSSCLSRNSYRQAYYPVRTDVYVGFRTCAL